MPHIATFSGEYDLADKEELRTQLDALHDKPDVVLDLSAVTYLDSSFISELVRLHDARKEQGFPTEVLVIQKDSAVERIFSVVGMAPLFNVVESLSDDKDASVDSTLSNERVINVRLKGREG
jgi:anti-anti-sigma factor